MLFNKQIETITLKALETLIKSYVKDLLEEGMSLTEAIQTVKEYIFNNDLKIGITFADSIYDS